MPGCCRSPWSGTRLGRAMPLRSRPCCGGSGSDRPAETRRRHLMHADFAHSPSFIPDFLRRLESGADIVVAQSSLTGESSRACRLVRRFAPLLLRGRVRVPGVADVVSGFLAFRLVALRNALRAQNGRLLTAEGWSANAELIGKTARLRPAGGNDPYSGTARSAPAAEPGTSLGGRGSAVALAGETGDAATPSAKGAAIRSAPGGRGLQRVGDGRSEE